MGTGWALQAAPKRAVTACKYWSVTASGPEAGQQLMGIDQMLLPITLWKQVRDEAQAQLKSLASSSAVAVSEVVAALQATRINFENAASSEASKMSTKLYRIKKRRRCQLNVTELRSVKEASS